MPVFQAGSINTTALIVPDLYVQVVPPQVSQMNGVPTNKVGHIGTASWGPVNSPVVFGDMSGYSSAFGPIMNRKYDMGTQVAAAVLQGANNHVGVRVTDGTDTSATATIKDPSDGTGVTLTTIYSGSLGNDVLAVLTTGSKAQTYKLSVALPGQVPEVFDNIEGTGATFWANLVAAVNQGQNAMRGPSQIVVATVGASTTAPGTPQTLNFIGGTDGAAVSGTDLVGVDITPRSGMYALRGTQVSVAALADLDDSTTYTAQLAFGLAEGVYMVAVGPAGQSIAAAISAKNTAGIDSYAIRIMLGDWVYWNDNVNSALRLISPQGFVAGRLANLSPEQSTLNKPIYGIVGTQATNNNKVYSSAELAQLTAAGIDVITNPVPGGNYFGCRIGHNTSSDVTTNGDNYTRMTNYIASTLSAGAGKYIGQVQTPEERQDAAAVISSFLANMANAKPPMIGDVNGGPAFQVTLDTSNNPQSRVAQGYQQCDVKVVYLGIVEKFIINMEGGASVQVSRVSTQAA